MRSRAYGLLKPRGKFMQRWDIATAGALAFTLFVTPFEVGMDLPTSIDGGFIVLFVINQIVALIFLIDVCVNFVLPTPNGTKGGYERRHWVRNADRTRCLLRTPFFAWYSLIRVARFDLGPRIQLPLQLVCARRGDHHSV